MLGTALHQADTLFSRRGRTKVKMGACIDEGSGGQEWKGGMVRKCFPYVY